MHSFHPSRGRILFEVLCAMAISASCATAWMQTGASALLGAAGAAALYGLVHLFDMKAPKPAEAAQPQPSDAEPEVPDTIVPMFAAEDPPAVDPIIEEAEAVEAAPARSGSGRRSGGSRKGGGRRSKAEKKPKATFAPAEEADVPRPMAADASPAQADQELAFVADEEATHPHIAPLFEPEPFARMPRGAFGRRGRL